MQKDMDEFAFINQIRAQAQLPPGSQVSLGIGDDAAAVRLDATRETLVAADMLMEGVHFDFTSVTAKQAGRKALAVNLSDLAAMAAIPRFALLSVALTSQTDQYFASEILQGFLELAGEFDTALIGGDTNAWSGPCVISVTVIGEATEQGIVKRDGAQVGDAIFVTGELGGSLLGRHLDFTPRVQAALSLHRHINIHAMIDLSDGLASDLPHILGASQVGAILQQDAVPVSESATHLNDTLTPWEHAIGDGEDFELLFTAHEKALDSLPDEILSDIRVTKIGNIIAEKELLYRDQQGELHPLPATGWHHQL